MDSNLDRDQLIIRKTAVVERKLDDASFLIDKETNTIFHLNLIGSAVWHLLAEPQNVSEAASLLCAAFPKEDKKIITEDVTKLFEQLVERGLAVPVNSPATD